MQETKASRVFLVSSVVLGLVAAVVAFAYLNKATSSENGPKTKIVVAKHELRSGTLLDPDKDFETLEIPAHMTELIIRCIKPDDAANYKGQRINRMILAGTPIMMADTVEAKDLELAPKMVAMSIAAKGPSGVSGLLVPGDRVKLLVTVPTVAATTEPVEARPLPSWQSFSVLNDPVRVLAVGSRLTKMRSQIMVSEQYSSAQEPEAQQTVTLELTEEQAMQVQSQTGGGQYKLTLILVSPAK